MDGGTVQRENTQTYPLQLKFDGEECGFLMPHLHVKRDIKKKTCDQTRSSRQTGRTVQRENIQTLLLQFRLHGEICSFLMLHLRVKPDILKKELSKSVQ